MAAGDPPVAAVGLVAAAAELDGCILMDLHLAISYPKVTKFRAAGLR